MLVDLFNALTDNDASTDAVALIKEAVKNFFTELFAYLEGVLEIA